MLTLQNNPKEFNKFRAGSGAAFRFLIDQYWSSLSQYALDLCKNTTLTHQYLLQAISEAWDYRACFSSEDELVFFLYFKSKCKIEGVEQDSHQKNIGEREFLRWRGVFGGGEMELERLESGIDYLVWLAVEKLPSQRRKVIKGFYYEGKSTAQLAADMNLSSQTILNHKSKGEAFLKKELPVQLYRYRLTGILPH